jgi:uncharacterized protein YtpQ (UPF0354 family)
MFFKKKLLSETEFSTKFANQLTKKINGIKIISINNLEVICEFKEVSDYKHFLDNCYSEYLHDPKKIKEIIEKYVNSGITVYIPKEKIIAERIFPIIKDKRFIKGLKEINVDFEKSHIYEPYNEELFIFYAEDGENTIHYISRKELEEINFPIENLKEKATENLLKNLEMKRHGEDGYYMITAGGNYESSIILLNIWNHDNFSVNGDFVIGIPSRDILFVTGSKDSINLHRLYDSVKSINETGDHLVSDKIFEFKNGRFELL